MPNIPRRDARGWRLPFIASVVHAEHCAACHDGNTVRAPQRYVLENVSPETILTAMIDGPMRAVASELSMEWRREDETRVAVAESCVPALTNPSLIERRP